MTGLSQSNNGAGAGAESPAGPGRKFLDRLVRAIVCLAPPASLIFLADIPYLNILTVFYALAIAGGVYLMLGARMPLLALRFGAILAAWYVILLCVDLVHGGPFHYPLQYEANFAASFFPLLAFPFAAVALASSGTGNRGLETVAAISVAAAAALGIYQLAILDIPRPQGLTSNAIVFAFVVLVWTVWLFARGLQASGGVHRIVLFAAVPLGLAAIAISGSKLVWICSAVSLGGIAVRELIRPRRWTVLAGCAVACIPAAWLLYQAGFVRDRFTELRGDLAQVIVGNFSGSSVGLRLGMAISSLHAFFDRPFLGYGLVQSKMATVEHTPEGVAKFDFLYHLHNEYLTLAVAFGVLGLAFLATLLGLLVIAAMRTSDPALRLVGFAVTGSLAIYMLAEVFFLHAELTGTLFFLLAMLVATTPGPPRIDAGSLSRFPAWALPAVLAIVAVLGAAGFAWSERDIVMRVAQTVVVSEHATPARSAIDVKGSVVWRLIRNGDSGPEIVADVDIPQRDTRITLSFQKNADPSLPASHIIGFVGETPAAFPGLAIENITAIAFIPFPGAATEPLEGTIVKSGANSFIMGLSPAPPDIARNIAFMRDRSFLTVELTYASGQRADLLIEKGSSGVPLFIAALTQWNSTR